MKYTQEQIEEMKKVMLDKGIDIEQELADTLQKEIFNEGAENGSYTWEEICKMEESKPELKQLYDISEITPELIDLLERKSVWSVPEANKEPDVTLYDWAAFKVQCKGLPEPTIHFVGRLTPSDGEGRVCSPIQSFDINTQTGLTQSGKYYKLHGTPSGPLGNGEYVWWQWLSRNGVKVEDVENVSKDYHNTELTDREAKESYDAYQKRKLEQGKQNGND